MKYVKENFYTLNFSRDIGLYIKEVKGYILELDGVLYGLARNDENSNRYVLTHIGTGLKIPFEEYKHKKTLEGFLSNLSAYNEKINRIPPDTMHEMVGGFTKVLKDANIDYEKYIQTFGDGWKYTVARVNKKED